MSVPNVAELKQLNRVAIPGNPNPSSRWRWMTRGVKGVDGAMIKLQVWYVGNRPFTTDAAVKAFLAQCTEAQEIKAGRRAAKSEDVTDCEMAAVGL